MNFKVNEEVRVLSYYDLEWAIVVKVNRTRVKVRFNNGYETSVYPDKIAKMDEKIGVVWVNNLKYGSIADRYYIDRTKYPQFHSEAKHIPRQLCLGYIQEDENGNLLAEGEIYDGSQLAFQQAKVNQLLNILKSHGV